MDFYGDDDDFSAPCLLIESSQVEDGPISCQKDADPLNLRFQSTRFGKVYTSRQQLLRNDDRTTLELASMKIINALSGAGGKDSSKPADNNSSSNNTTVRTQQQQPGQAQASTSGLGGGGGGEGGDGNDGDRPEERRTEPDTCDESTEHSEESGSSSIPELIPAGDKQVVTECCDTSCSDSNPSIKLGNTSLSSSSSTDRGHHETNSQASTALADEIYQSRLESSEEGIPQLKKKSSSSSSIGKSKSDTSSSSIYPASNASSLNASSLSSDATPSPLHVLDTVKEDREEEELCSQDLFMEKEDCTAISSQEVSRICTPQDRSTPVENKQVKIHGPDLYKQALTRTSTPLGGSQFPPIQGGFNCLQLSGSSSNEHTKSDHSHGSFIEAPLITPSSPTEHSVKYTSVAATGSSSSSDIIIPSPNSFHSRKEVLSSTPEETSHSSEKHDSNEQLGSLYQQTAKSTSGSNAGSFEIINPSPDSFHFRAASLPSTPEEQAKPSSRQNSEATDDDEFAGIPRWQQELLAKQKETVKTSSTSESHNASSSSYNIDDDNDDDRPETHPWQSVMESSKSESADVREKSTTVKHVTFLMDKGQSQPVQGEDDIAAQSNDSFSPFSLVVDEQHGLAKLISPHKKQRNAGCSQPDLSEDLFCASTFNTQETSDSKNKDDKDSSGFTTKEDGERQDAFDLYLTQSQPDSPIFPAPTESPNPLSAMLEPSNTDPPQQHASSSTKVSQRPCGNIASVNESQKVIKDVMPVASVSNNQDNTRQIEDTTMVYRSLTQHSATEPPQLSRCDTEPVQEHSTSNQNPQQAPAKVNTGAPLLSSEVSTESLTGFHFSLPPTIGEVLVASTCTTPPPIRSWQPPVSETSIGPAQTSDSEIVTSPTPQPPKQSLTFSMPRLDSPDSEHVGISLPINEPSTSTTPIPSTTRPTEMSIFSRARKEAKKPSNEETTSEDSNPFLFSSQDVPVGPPVSKRQKPKESTTSIATTDQQPETSMTSGHTAFINTTTVQTYKTFKVEVTRVITIVTTREDNDEIVETLVYEEKEDPVIEVKKDEKVNVERIVETGTCAYVRQPNRPVTSEQLPRVSPRRKRHRNKSDSDDNKTQKTPRPNKLPHDEELCGNKKQNSETEQDDMVTPRLQRQSTNETEPVMSDDHETPSIAKGARVFARWSDGYYYPGVVIARIEFSTAKCYEIRFDDGDKRKVRPQHVIVREFLDIGQSIFAQSTDGYYDEGTIVGRYSTPTDTGYEVELQKSKRRKRYTQGCIILSETQVKSLARTSSSSSTESSKLLKSSSSNVSSGGTVKSRDTSAKDTSGSSNELTTKEKEETPKSSRKRRRNFTKRKRRQAGASSSEGSAEGKKSSKRVKRGLLNKLSVPTRTSPRKKAQVYNNDTKTSPRQSTQIPTNDTIFAGFAFLITRCCNVLSDSESELQEFDRVQIERQIEAGGGVILKDFGETQSTIADRCFLISNSYCRTVKYFHCLANGIPMVSHMWIHDCSVLNRLQDYKNYLLPAGRSLETGEVVECRTRAKLLSGLTVFLHGDTRFRSTWINVLQAAGAQVIMKLPNRPSRAARLEDDELCNVVISEVSSLPQSLQHTCELLGIPIVGLEWLFQCLINGYIVDYDGHPKYDYRHTVDGSDVT